MSTFDTASGDKDCIMTTRFSSIHKYYKHRASTFAFLDVASKVHMRYAQVQMVCIYRNDYHFDWIMN